VIQSDLGRPVWRVKIFRFAPAPNQWLSFTRPAPKEGRFAIVTDVGSGMRWTRQRQAQSLRGRMMLQRTAKSRGSGAPTLALSQWYDPLMTVARKPGHREEREGNR